MAFLVGISQAVDVQLGTVIERVQALVTQQLFNVVKIASAAPDQLRRRIGGRRTESHLFVSLSWQRRERWRRGSGASAAAN